MSHKKRKRIQSRVFFAAEGRLFIFVPHKALDDGNTEGRILCVVEEAKVLRGHAGAHFTVRVNLVEAKSVPTGPRVPIAHLSFWPPGTMVWIKRRVWSAVGEIDERRLVPHRPKSAKDEDDE